MNAEKLMRAIGGISDRHIEEFAVVKPVSSTKITWLKIVSIAACFAIIVVFLYAKHHQNNDEMYTMWAGQDEVQLNGAANTPDNSGMIEKNISVTFQNLGVEDAEYIGIRTLDYGMPGDLRLYHSKSTGMDYYFYADTGILKQASFENMEDADANPVQLPGQIVSEDTVTDPDELRQQTAIKFAEACVDVIRIGELKIDAENNVADMLYKYTIYEYYDDIQTGTRVQLYFTPKGALISCVVRQGELFKKDADGNVFMVRDGEKISEDAAIAIARKAVLDKLKEANWDYDIFDDQTKCSLQTTENQLVYGVEIRTGYAETDEWMRTFRVDVNVLDGSIWFMDWTQ